jgi:hypothetical protein
MPKVTCHVPLKVRFVGEPTEEAWAALEDRLTAQFTQALRRSLEALARRRPEGESAKESFDPPRMTAKGYLVPSYDEGQPTPVTIQEQEQALWRISSPPLAIAWPKPPTLQELEQAALIRITELLRTGLFPPDFGVTAAEAHEALEILQNLPPEGLLYTVREMRKMDRYRVFAKALSEPDRQTLSRLEEFMDPNLGYLMPGDRIQLTVWTGGAGEPEINRLEIEIRVGGVYLPFLPRPVPVVGLLPQAAAERIARAYVEALVYTRPFVTLGVVARGFHYAGRNQGPFPNPIEFTAAPFAADSPEGRRAARRAEFLAYVQAVPVTDSLTAAALQRYLEWVGSHEKEPEFFTRRPPDVWEWALAAKAAPPFRSPLRPFLELQQSMTARLSTAPPEERDRLRETLSRYTAWLDLHAGDPGLSRFDPVQVWVDASLHALKARIAEDVRASRAAREQAQAAAAISPAAQRKFDAALRLMMSQVWQIPAAQTAEDPEHGVGYLIQGSQAERRARDEVARGFMNDVLRRMTDPHFTETTVEADFADWLRAHRKEFLELQLSRAYPDVERYAVEVRIPEWQTAIEIGIGFIPIVGQVVGAYEVIAGEDLFGHPLSTTDRAILGAAIFLPAAGKLFKGGRALLTASQIARDYRLTAPEAEALYRATLGIRPGSPGARVLSRAADDVKAGRPVRDPQRLQEIEGVLRDMGMTDRSTAQALEEAGEQRAGYLPPSGPAGGERGIPRPGGPPAPVPATAPAATPPAGTPAPPLQTPQQLGRAGEVARQLEVELEPERLTRLIPSPWVRARIYSVLERGKPGDLLEFARALPADGAEQVYFRTSRGKRFIDHLFLAPGRNTVVLRESKNVADFAITSDVRRQLAIDMEILDRYPEAVVHWRISGNGRIEPAAYDILQALVERTGGRFRFQLQDSVLPPFHGTSPPPTLH